MSVLSKVFRYSAFGVLALVLASLLALSYLVVTFDPDDYRDDLINLVEEQTGRAFTIDGSLELHLDPPLVGFEVHDIWFDNPAGFVEAGPRTSVIRRARAKRRESTWPRSV